MYMIREVMNMKTIKYLGIFLLMALQTLGMASCSGEDYETRLHELILKDLDFTAEENTYEKEFRNEDLSNYSISSDKDWCKVEIDADASKLYVSVDANETFDDRTATITMKDELDGVTTRTFTVKQKQNNAVKVKEGEYRVSTEGGLVEIDVESNVTYKVEVLNASWVTVVSPAATRGLEPSKVVLNVEENKSGSARQATVRVYNTATGAEDVTVLTQEFKARWSVPQTVFTIDERGGEIKIHVQTNVEFDSYTIPEDAWVDKTSREVNEELGIVTQKVFVSAFNQKKPSRTTTITLQNTDWNFKEEVTITQTRNLYIEDSDFKLLTTQSKQLTLYNADDVAVVWKTSDETVATVDGQGNVVGVGEGTATIRVLSSDGVHSDKVDVTVEAPKALDSQIGQEWSYSYYTEGDIKVVSAIASTVTNNSSYDILLKSCSLYRDEEEVSTIAYDEQTGLLATGRGKRADFTNLVIYITEEVPDPEPEPTVNGSATGGEESSSAGARRSTRATVTKIDTQTHSYYVLWKYSYAGSTFTLKCLPPTSAARKATLKAVRSRR